MPQVARSGSTSCSLTLSVFDNATGDTVAITTDRATVAQWRQARSEAIHNSDTRSLQVYKAATNFLEEAERYGFADGSSH